MWCKKVIHADATPTKRQREFYKTTTGKDLPPVNRQEANELISKAVKTAKGGN